MYYVVKIWDIKKGNIIKLKKSTVGEIHDLSNNVGVISKEEIEVSPPLTK